MKAPEYTLRATMADGSVEYPCCNDIKDPRTTEPLPLDICEEERLLFSAIFGLPPNCTKLESFDRDQAIADYLKEHPES